MKYILYRSFGDLDKDIKKHELELDKLGDEKSALFFLISDTDTTYNFLVALAFSQMFNLLCERADNTYGGRLPYHVRVLWDEAANTGQVPGLEGGKSPRRHRSCRGRQYQYPGCICRTVGI